METENVNNLQDIRIAPNSNGKHQVILIAKSVGYAESLKYDLGIGLTLSYTYDDDMNNFYLIFTNIMTNKNALTVSIDVSEKTLAWMNWINEKSVIEVWVGHPDGRQGFAPYGSAVPVHV